MLVRLGPSADSARAARDVVAAAAVSLGRADLGDDATAVVSELVANAVLHARTDITVAVRLEGDGLRIDVTDKSRQLPRSSPGLGLATSGRGLLVVEQLATAWGAEPLPSGGKTVWAQVDQAASMVDELSVDELLAQWDDDLPAPATPEAIIEVSVEIEVRAMLASRTHTDDLVRALQLTLLEATTRLTTTSAPVATTRREVLDLAQRLIAAHEQFGEARRQMWNQTFAAAQQGLDHTTLHLHLHPSDAATADSWLSALSEADALSEAGKLLLPPSPKDMVVFRGDYISAIIEQLSATPPSSPGRAVSGLVLHPTPMSAERSGSSWDRSEGVVSQGKGATDAPRVSDDRDLHDALRGLLDVVEDAAPVDAVEAATRELAVALSALSVSFLIADLSGRALVRLTHSGTLDAQTRSDPRSSHSDTVDGGRHHGVETAVGLAIDGSGPADVALRTRAVQVLAPGTDAGLGEPSDVGWTVLAPVTERGESLGLLEMVLPAEPCAAVAAEIARTAHLLGFVVVASRRHTDLFEWGQRSTPYTLSAEIQRRLLPAAYTCEAGSFTLSAWLEPSASVGGDTYDYSLARDALHLSMTDAMGHGVDSALIATLCVGSLRNSRRHGLSLTEQATAANGALCSRGGVVSTEGFSTGLLGRLDLASGMLELVNAGHAAPYLLRDGAVRHIEVPPHLPFGLFPDVRYTSTSVQLQPGDRLVLVTDGMLERNAEDFDLLGGIAATRHLHPREATRHLTDLVLEVTGQALADDSTLLMVDWHAHHGRDRQTRAGRAVRNSPA